MPRVVKESADGKSPVAEKITAVAKDFELEREFLTRKEKEHSPKTEVLLESTTVHQSKASMARLWDWESSGPVPQHLFRLYELQTDLFLVTHKLVREDWLDHR